MYMYISLVCSLSNPQIFMAYSFILQVIKPGEISRERGTCVMYNSIVKY